MIGQEVFFSVFLSFRGLGFECGNECVVGEVFMSGGGFCRWSVCYFLCLGEGLTLGFSLCVYLTQLSSYVPLVRSFL